jgi:hypothetical protein
LGDELGKPGSQMGRPGLLVSHRLFRSSPPRFFGSKWDFGRSFVYSSDGSKHRATSQQQHEQQRQQPEKLNWIIRGYHFFLAFERRENARKFTSPGDR